VSCQGKKKLQQKEEKEEVMAKEKEKKTLVEWKKRVHPGCIVAKRRERELQRHTHRGKFDRGEEKNFGRGGRKRVPLDAL
jgi:hypothetical protein